MDAIYGIWLFVLTLCTAFGALLFAVIYYQGAKACASDLTDAFHELGTINRRLDHLELRPIRGVVPKC